LIAAGDGANCLCHGDHHRVDYATGDDAAILRRGCLSWSDPAKSTPKAARKGLVGNENPNPCLLPARVNERGWPFLPGHIFLVWGLLYMRWQYYAPCTAKCPDDAAKLLQRETMIDTGAYF